MEGTSKIEIHDKYLIELREELKTLWIEANNENLDKETKDSKLANYWTLYRRYREQRQQIQSLFA